MILISKMVCAIQSNIKVMAIHFQALRKSVFAGVPTFNSYMLTESDDNVTITMGMGCHFLSAPIVRLLSIYSSTTGTQIIKFTRRPPPDTMCTVTVHVFTVPESKCKYKKHHTTQAKIHVAGESLERISLTT